ncbi:MAG: hypothetical protein KAQ83_03800 [Nanoarchaeota archaeon]|nr:hypothetical protein [Nanoarchaeota archaeon]
MEPFQESMKKAKHETHIADHMIFITYKVVNNPKLLLSALRKILASMIHSLDSLLQYERLFKRIPALPQSHTSRLLLLKDYCTRRYGLSQNYIYLIKELNDLIIAHEKSPVEFSRNSRFIICSDNYRMKTITINKIKEYLSLNKAFLIDVEKITKNNGIFR